MKVFKEEQRFTQTWLIVLLGVSLTMPVVIIASAYFKDNSKMSTNEFIFTVLGIIICGIFIFFFKLKTRIDELGVHYQFFPFHLSFRKISWQEIAKIHIRNYEPISEYGGWGLKGGWSKTKGKAINVSGDIGIQLALKNGKKLLIGTQKKEEVKRVLETYKNKII